MNEDWATLLAGIAKGTAQGYEAHSLDTTNKKQAKEAKRRLFSNMLSQQGNRDQYLYSTGQENRNDLADYQAQAMQQVARNFVNTLQGSTRR